MSDFFSTPTGELFGGIGLCALGLIITSSQNNEATLTGVGITITGVFLLGRSLLRYIGLCKKPKENEYIKKK